MPFVNPCLMIGWFVQMISSWWILPVILRARLRWLRTTQMLNFRGKNGEISCSRSGKVDQGLLVCSKIGKSAEVSSTGNVRISEFLNMRKPKCFTKLPRNRDFRYSVLLGCIIQALHGTRREKHQEQHLTLNSVIDFEQLKEWFWIYAIINLIVSS